jgi:hypothetical protein
VYKIKLPLILLTHLKKATFQKFFATIGALMAERKPRKQVLITNYKSQKRFWLFEEREERCAKRGKLPVIDYSPR